MDFPEYTIDDEMIADNQNSYSEEEYEESDEDDYSNIPQQGTSTGYVCDTCERKFETYWQHQKHMNEHRTCGIDGCTFTAHEKIIEKHVQMQHSTGLYDKIRNLNTPEDISKWIEERKKKYPKKENVEKRYKQQEEMLKRGEKLQRNSSRFDKHNKTRFSLNGKNKSNQRSFKKKLPSRRKIIQQQQKRKPISLIDDKSDWNGSLFPFKGTSQLYNEESVEEISNDFDDAEWLEEVVSVVPEKIVLKNALGALMSAYDSGDDSEVEDLIPKNEKPKAETQITNIPKAILSERPKKVETVILADNKNIETPIEGTNQQNIQLPIENPSTLSDDEAPTEQKIERVDILPEPTSQAQNNNKSTRKRKRVHKKGRNSKHGSNNNPNKQQKFENIFKKRRITLLERLLANEITHERNVLLQCVKYVVSNKFFDDKVSDDKQNEIKTPECEVATTSIPIEEATTS